MRKSETERKYKKELKRFDPILKEIFSKAAGKLISIATGEKIEEKLEDITGEIEFVKSLRPDLLFRAKEKIFHIEIQVQTDKTLPERMLIYSLAIKEKFGKKPIQIVLFVGKGNPPFSFFKDEFTLHKFIVVDMKKIDPDEFIKSKKPEEIIIGILAGKFKEKPQIYGGGGIIASGAHEELEELVDILGIPVTLTLMGLGGFDGTRPEFLGMLGMHGTYTANMAINNSDLVFAIGARFDDRVTGNIEYFAPLAKIIHIDIDPASISKNIDIDVPIVGDAKNVLKKMLQIIKSEVPKSEIKKFRERIEPWWEKIREWQQKFPLTYKKSQNIIKPQELIETTYELTKNESVIITTDVGQHQMWAAQYYKIKEPRTWITSGGLGTMGFGFPAAIGAKIAKPSKLVICFAGDGSFQMNMQELATAVEEKVGVRVIIFNNGEHGMVTQWQRKFYGRRYAASRFKVQPDYKKLAESFGAIGYKIEHPSELKEKLTKAIFEEPEDIPVIIDVKVDPEEDVYPMVPPGSPPTEMLLS